MANTLGWGRWLRVLRKEATHHVLPALSKPIRTISGFLELISRFDFEFRRRRNYIF